jgi:hypothetical protein
LRCLASGADATALVSSSYGERPRALGALRIDRLRQAGNSGRGGMTERPGDQPHALGALPPLERLVNLTDHAITVDLLTTSPHGEDGAPVPGTATFAPDGRLARVLDDQVRLGDGSVNTPSGLLRETRLRRRPGPVAGLPPAEPGVRYLVSRITALAVHGRPDLVFPFGERRDAQGRVTGVRGLAAFPSDRAIAGRYRDWRRRAAERRSRRPLTGEWRTGLLFALATAFLSAWLGLLPGSSWSVSSRRRSARFRSTWPGRQRSPCTRPGA